MALRTKKPLKMKTLFIADLHEEPHIHR